MTTETTKKLLTLFMRRLTNLGGHNRSLWLARTSEAFLDLHAFSQLNGESSFSLIESLLLGKSSQLSPVTDPRSGSANDASRRIKNLLRLDQFQFDERGARDLHVGWPFVRGRFADGTPVRCPLLFFPVKIDRRGDFWVMSPREDQSIIVNSALILAASFFNETIPDESLLQETFEDTDRDATSFLTALYHHLRQSSFQVNFNSDLYTRRLENFQHFTRQTLEEEFGPGMLKLFSEAVLGLFPQDGSTLVPDYQQLLNSETLAGLDELFNRNQPESPATENFIPLVREEKMHTLYPADIWQENVMKASKLGHSLVVQGPPGTGKSQVITNLISDAIASGKRVLLVCQKRVALDVVQDRLQQKGLTDFVGCMHDFAADRKAIYAKIASQIERTDEYRTRNISVDAIQLDRQFLQTSKNIDHLVEELESFRQSLLEHQTCGLSIRELYLQSDPEAPSISLKQEFAQFRFDQDSAFLRQLEYYASYVTRFDRPDYAWQNRVSFHRFTVQDKLILLEHLKEVHPFLVKIKSAIREATGAAVDWEGIKLLMKNRLDLQEMAKITTHEPVMFSFRRLVSEKEETDHSLSLANFQRRINDCLSSPGVETSVTADALGTFQKALHRASRARRGLWSWLRWQLFSNEKTMISRALVANQLTSDKKDFAVLEEKLDRRLNLEHNLTRLRQLAWVTEPPTTYTREQFEAWFAQHQQAIRASVLFQGCWGSQSLFHPSAISDQVFQERLKKISETLALAERQLEIWAPYFTSNQINLLDQDMKHAENLAAVLQRDFDALCDMDRMSDGFSTMERGVIEKLKELNPAPAAGDWKKIIHNSLCLAWIDYIETKHPELRMASTGKIEQLENTLLELLESKQRLSTEIILLRARERVTEGLAFNRLRNRVTYRDLLHQTTKKKKIWPLRKLIAEFAEEIFQLVPCWLASPETVSAIFPMTDIFDLVIFDEASQCFAERGLPALCRGKQVIIAGDNQQLRPGDFYRARWQDDTWDEADAEVESLLELAQHYLMTLTLRGHYRSRTPELIEFSNRHFYNSRLEMLPEYRVAQGNESPMEFRKVNGRWDNQTNEVEAEEVIRLVTHWQQREPGKTIGVITFNAPQQMLIQDLLEDAALELRGGFVKNIENVQGDESDIIIFSIAYAPSKDGVVRAQFGSLNMAGGENRLNVAVSRARERIIIVTSIEPDDLNVSDTKNDGPKLLKEYLRFAQHVATGNPATEIQNRKASLWLKDNIAAQNKLQDATRWLKNPYPAIDLGCFADDMIKSLALTDDDHYIGSLSAKSPHALLPQLLTQLNWPYRRVYSRNFWNHRADFWMTIEKMKSRN